MGEWRGERGRGMEEVEGSHVTDSPEHTVVRAHL